MFSAPRQNTPGAFVPGILRFLIRRAASSARLVKLTVSGFAKNELTSCCDDPGQSVSASSTSPATISCVGRRTSPSLIGLASWTANHMSSASVPGSPTRTSPSLPRQQSCGQAGRCASSQLAEAQYARLPPVRVQHQASCSLPASLPTPSFARSMNTHSALSSHLSTRASASRRWRR